MSFSSGTGPNRGSERIHRRARTRSPGRRGAAPPASRPGRRSVQRAEGVDLPEKWLTLVHSGCKWEAGLLFVGMEKAKMTDLYAHTPLPIAHMIINGILRHRSLICGILQSGSLLDFSVGCPPPRGFRPSASGSDPLDPARAARSGPATNNWRGPWRGHRCNGHPWLPSSTSAAAVEAKNSEQRLKERRNGAGHFYE